MQLSILDNTLSTPVNLRRGVDLTQFKAGDRLDARIVQIASSGRTVLQFSGFRAAVDGLIGGREGDVLQFEVLPDEKPVNTDRTRRPSTSQSNASAGTRGPNGRQQHSKVIRLNALTGPGVSRPNAKEKSHLAPKPISQTPPFTLSTATQTTTLPAHSFKIMSTWFRRILKNRQPLGRNRETRLPTLAKSELTKGLSQAKPTERPGMLDLERIDRPREFQPVADYNTFHLGNWPVKMKIYGRPAGNHADKHRILLKATFLLNLEHTGAVRTDIQMGDNQINVGFFLESEDYLANFEKALPELTAALSPLVNHCYCHVTVSPPKIYDFLKEEGGYPDSARFDIRA